MKKIKVLQVTAGLDVGGLETVAMNIVRYTDRSQFDFDFLVYGNKIGAYEKEAIALGCNVIHLNKSKNYLNFYNMLKKVIKSGSYDIVYSHTFFNSGIVLRAAKKCGVKKCIAHAHSTARPIDKSILRRIFYFTMREWLNNYADVRLACSKDAGDYVYGKKSGYIVVKNGIKAEDFAYNSEIRKKLRKELSLGDSYVVGNISRLSEAKNHIFLIHAFYDLLKIYNNSILLLVGDGNLKNKIQTEIEKLRISEHVIMTGIRSDIPALLSAMDTFIFPSIHEGVGISAIEAQASGLPVLCSDTVPEEVKITDLLVYKSLTEGEEAWAQALFEMKRKTKRCSKTEAVLKSGYGIEDCMKKIENILLEKY